MSDLALSAAIYARFSSRAQDGNTSIEGQLSETRRLLSAENLSCSDSHIYIDRARSGRSEAGREAFARLLADARSRQFRVVAVHKYDRLGRNFEETMLALADLRRCGVRVLSATESADRFTRNILLAVAEEDARKHGDRIRLARQVLAESGLRSGGRAPYGYRSVLMDDPAGRQDRQGRTRRRATLVIHEAEAEVVRRICRAYVAGQGQLAIAQALNADGIPGPSGPWTVSGIRYILRNTAYRGALVHGRRARDGPERRVVHGPDRWVVRREAHPVILDTVLAGQVEARQEQVRALAAGKNYRAAYSPSLLSGVLVCGICGGRFVWKKNQQGRSYYSCSRRASSGLAACPNRRHLRADTVDRAVVGVLSGLAQVPGLVDQLLQKGKAGKRPDVAGQLARLDAEIARLVEGIRAVGVSPALAEALRVAEARKAAMLREADSPPAAQKEWTRGLLKQALREIATRADREIVLAEVERIGIPDAGSLEMKMREGGLLWQAGQKVEILTNL